MNRYLQAGTHVKRQGHSDKYEIKDIVGAGASCAVYYAELVDTSSVRTEHLLKEYNPRGLKLERDETGCLHICSERDAMAFESGLIRFKTGYEMQLNVRCCSDVKNSTSNIQGVFEANGTCYIDMTVMAGKTYEKVEEKTLYDLLRRIEAITKVVGSYHENGLLHLDIKPENIFTLPETVELVQMFDFDSVIKKTDVNKSVFLSCTQSWAAQEQILPNRRNRICEATDIFAIGEMLFYKLMGRHSESHERRSFASFSFDYSKVLFEGVNPRVFPLLSEILRHTICNVTTNRYQTTAAFLEKLKEAIALSDPHKPFLQHHLPPKAAYFVGRDAELRQIDESFAYTDKLFISGVGGIGKSELARQYAHAHKDEYDAVIFSVCNTDLESMILDDSMLPVSNVRQWPDEKARDYCNRKLRELKQLCNKRVLIIVDNFNDMQDNLLNKLLKLDCRLLFTTRCDVSGWNYEQLCLGSLDEEYVWDIFRTWYRSPLDNADHTAVEQILNLYQGHTMAVELIAKQMRASCVTPRQMLDKLNAGGFGDSGRERVAHTKDGVNTKGNIHDHIRRLFDVSDLSEDKDYILANLSLIPPSGIDKRRFHDWCKLDSFEDINELTDSGWIRQEEESKIISLHPVIADVMLDELEKKASTCLTMLNTIAEFVGSDRFDCLESDRRGVFACVTNSIMCKAERISDNNEAYFNFVDVVASKMYSYGNITSYMCHVKKALTLQEKSEHGNDEIIASLYNTLGILLAKTCQFSAAEESYHKSLRIKHRVLGTKHIEIATTYCNLAMLYDDWGDFKKAKECHQKALEMMSELVGEKNVDMVHSLINYAAYCYKTGDQGKTEELLLRVLHIQDNLQRKIHIDTATACNNLAVLYSDCNRLDEAEAYYLKALNIRQNLFGTDHIETAVVYGNLGLLYAERKQYSKAMDYQFKALHILVGVFGDSHISAATLFDNIGSLYDELGEPNQAYVFCEKALRIRLSFLGPDKSETAYSYNNLASIYCQLGQHRKAEEMYLKALDIWRSCYGDVHFTISTVCENLSILYSAMGNEAEAKKYRIMSYHVLPQNDQNQ